MGVAVSDPRDAPDCVFPWGDFVSPALSLEEVDSGSEDLDHDPKLSDDILYSDDESTVFPQVSLTWIAIRMTASKTPVLPPAPLLVILLGSGSTTRSRRFSNCRLTP